MSVKSFEERRWSGFSQKPEFRHRAALKRITEGTVLDVGCGDGLFLNMLKERGIVAEGIDISEEAVRKCHERGLSARVGDFADASLPFEDASFEYVVALDVLEHVYDPAALLREMARVARKGVLIGVPNFSSLPARMQALRGAVPENNVPHKGHLYWFNYGVLKNMAKNVGLLHGEYTMNTFFPFTYLPPSITRAFPNLLALSFVGLFLKSR